MAVQLEPRERRLVSTGLAFEIPKDAMVGWRHGALWLHRAVAGGVIDADYRGEVK